MSGTGSRRKHLVLRGIVLGLVAGAILVARMPASLVAALVEARCAGRCRLVMVAGPWWAGNGQLFMAPSASGEWTSLGAVGWEALPATGGLAELQLGDGRAVVEAGIDGLRLRLDRIALPAGPVLSMPAFGLPASGWRGTLALSGVAAESDWRGNATAEGRAAWLDAASGLLERYPLGRIDAAWRWRGDGNLDARISGGAAGRIAIDVGLALAAPGDGRAAAATLAGDIRLEGDARERLDRYLRLLGRPDPAAPGRYEVKWPGS